MKRLPLAASFLLVTGTATVAHAETYYVASDGDNGNTGLQGAPWGDLQHAADTVGPGDTVIVSAGNYNGFYLETSGEDGAPIVFQAEDGVVIDQENAVTPDGINLEGASYVVIEGFNVVGTNRAGIRAVLGDHVTLRRNKSEDNFKWGILTGFCDNVVIEDNETSGSQDEHGIYVSNSADGPIIRRNRIHDNNANGLHMNGDAEQGGDGIISNALVEANVIWGNGQGGGGSGINCDGVQSSRIVNNLIYNTHASGISLYRIDGGGPSTGNTVVNNTVFVASNGRWALNIQDGSTGNHVYNNILLNAHSSRGSIDISADSLDGLVSDYNVLMDRMTTNGGDSILSLSEWQTQTGGDASSLVAGADTLFVSASEDDYHIGMTSPAVDAGTSTEAPNGDLENVGRPVGPAFDIGAYEYCEGDCPESPGGGGPGGGGPGGGGPGGGNQGGSGEGASSSGGSDGNGASTADGGGGQGDGSDSGDEGDGCGCSIPGASAADPRAWLIGIAIAGLAMRRRSKRVG